MIEWLYVVIGLVILLALSTKLNQLWQLIESFVQDGNGAYSLAPIVGVVHYETVESANPWNSALYAVLAIVLVWLTKKMVHDKKRKNENQLYIDLKLQIDAYLEQEARKIVEEEDLDDPISDHAIRRSAETSKHRLYNEYNRYEIANRDPRIDSTSDENHLVKALEKYIDHQTWNFLMMVENKREIWLTELAEAEAKAAEEAAETNAKLDDLVFQEPPSCRLCGKKTNLQIDHIVPLSHGGTTALDNLQTLCSRCNAQKFERRMIAYLQDQPDIAAVNQPPDVGSYLPIDAIIETIDGERYCIEIKYGEFNKCRGQVEAQWANTGLSIIFTYSYHEYGHYFWSSLPNEEE